MPAANHDLIADQGATFKLFMEYQTEGSTGINLDEYEARLDIRRSNTNNNLLLSIFGDTTGGSVLGGGSTGYFVSPDGVLGTGGMTLNSGSTGNYGYQGGIYIQVDPETMKNVPEGRHLYNLELIKGGDVYRILQGRFEVTPEIVR